MGRFNLLDEPWISVMINSRGETKDVSLLELFENAHTFLQLAGDTPTQNFAILRVLLAIMHTVFSRFNDEGEQYEFLELDQRFRETSRIHEDDVDDYADELLKTWKKLWGTGKFPPVIKTYLEAWRDRFNLFDEQYPFYQVTKDVVGAEKISKAKPSPVLGKNINRLISESANKISLFSPKFDAKNNKEFLTDAEIARWLITFQGYVGTSDKVIFGEEKYKSSKGWLFDIGGVTFGGKNLFETLLLNCVLRHPKHEYIEHSQKPCWEYDSSDLIKRYLSGEKTNNLSDLYTNWSRAIYVDPKLTGNDPFSFEIVKLPELDHQENFLEPMTLWRFNNSGENKGLFTPKKHVVSQSLWRSFGLVTMTAAKSSERPSRKPILMDWLNTIKKSIGEFDISIQATSMKDDGNATSWVPVDEIYDELNINDFVLTDNAERGWIPRINEVIEQTKYVVGFIYKNFIAEIKRIRNLSSNEFVSRRVEELYFFVDQPFKEWLSSIKPDDSKDERLIEWRKILRKLVLLQAEKQITQSGNRDYVGIVVDERIINVATAFNSFIYFLEKQLKLKEVSDGAKGTR